MKVNILLLRIHRGSVIVVDRPENRQLRYPLPKVLEGLSCGPNLIQQLGANWVKIPDKASDWTMFMEDSNIEC